MSRKGKQFVFSARTTEEGLKRQGELRQERRVGWDELVIEAVSEHYGLDRAMMTLLKKDRAAQDVAPQLSEPTDEKRPIEVREEKPTEETKPKKQGKGKK